MKLSVCLALSLVVTVVFMGLMKLRDKERALAEKHSKFQEIKLRVTQEVLDDYQRETESTQTLLDQTKTEVTATEKEINELKVQEIQKTGEKDTCQSVKKEISDQLGSLRTELDNKNAEFNKEKTNWEAEGTSLKQQLAQRSKVCDFAKDTAEVRLLCHGMVAPNPAKVEAPKQDEVKAGAPKQDEPKGEAPKQEEPKAEPKAEAPKQEEPKAEAPKQEEPKAEAPKQEEPKAEGPKQEEPKAEPKAEGPKQEEPKAEAPKQEEPKAEAPKQEEPKAEAPKQEEVKAEAPKRR